MENSCSCDKCKSSCLIKPGWFTPDQVNDLLEYFGVETIEELLPKGFAIDWYEKYNGGKDVLLLAPNIKGNEGEMQYPAKPGGECVFYDKDSGKCKIYEVRPFECAQLHHDESRSTIHDRHKQVAGQWKESDLLKDFEDQVETMSWSITDYMKGE